MSEHDYYLSFRPGRRGGELAFGIGAEGGSVLLIRLGGRLSRDVFVKTVDALARAGSAVPVRVGETSVYAVRGDVGPVIGAYLILVKRSRRVDYWSRFLEELLLGRYSRLGRAFATFLELAIELSRATSRGRRRRHALDPHVTLALSSALKVFVRQLEKYETKVLPGECCRASAHINRERGIV